MRRGQRINAEVPNDEIIKNLKIARPFNLIGLVSKISG